MLKAAQQQREVICFQGKRPAGACLTTFPNTRFACLTKQYGFGVLFRFNL